MIVGCVNDAREARIPLEVYGPGEHKKDIDAVLDTGFTDALALAPSVIAQLKLPYRGLGEFTVAGGSSVYFRTYEARVAWHGRLKDVIIVAAGGAALVGMQLLENCDVSLRVQPGGRVTIEPPDA